jgi:hypothetical protein
MNNINHIKISGDAPPVQKPEWIRPKDLSRLFGIGRTKGYELMNEGVIKSISLRKRGQQHGTRLISYDSVASYLNSLAEEPKP